MRKIVFIPKKDIKILERRDYIILLYDTDTIIEIPMEELEQILTAKDENEHTTNNTIWYTEENAWETDENNDIWDTE